MTGFPYVPFFNEVVFDTVVLDVSPSDAENFILPEVCKDLVK